MNKKLLSIASIILILGIFQAKSIAGEDLNPDRNKATEIPREAEVPVETKVPGKYIDIESCLASGLAPEGKLIDLTQEKASILLKKCELKLKERELDNQFQGKPFDLLEQDYFWQILAIILGAIAYFWKKGDENKIREEQYLREFKLKSAEIILNSKNPHAAEAKARALDTLFPNDVAENFADNFNPYEYEAAISEAMKMEIIKILTNNNNMNIASAYDELDKIIEKEENKLNEKIRQK
ncbi:MAG: hypothetical protein AAFQ80_19595 [Cyanobacteria bacterium J06621_8]